MSSSDDACNVIGETKNMRVETKKRSHAIDKGVLCHTGFAASAASSVAAGCGRGRRTNEETKGNPIDKKQ